MDERTAKCPHGGGELADPEMQRLLLKVLEDTPELLRQMRLVAAGTPPAKGYEWLTRLQTENPMQFIREKRSEESAYAEVQAKVLAARTVHVEEDADGDRIIGLAEAWLRERAGQ